MKSHLLLRLVGLILWLIGLALYLFLAFVGYMGLRDMQEQPVTLVLKTGMFIQHVVLVSGLVPLIVFAVLLIFFRTVNNFFVAVFCAIPVLLALHYVVAVYGGHHVQVVYWPLQLVEFLVGGAVIYMQTKGIKPFDK